MATATDTTNPAQENRDGRHAFVQGVHGVRYQVKTWLARLRSTRRSSQSCDDVFGRRDWAQGDLFPAGLARSNLGTGANCID
jgi:hypothetical protein